MEDNIFAREWAHWIDERLNAPILNGTLVAQGIRIPVYPVGLPVSDGGRYVNLGVSFILKDESLKSADLDAKTSPRIDGGQRNIHCLHKES